MHCSLQRQALVVQKGQIQGCASTKEEVGGQTYFHVHDPMLPCDHDCRLTSYLLLRATGTSNPRRRACCHSVKGSMTLRTCGWSCHQGAASTSHSLTCSENDVVCSVLDGDKISFWRCRMLYVIDLGDESLNRAAVNLAYLITWHIHRTAISRNPKI